jgi:hypothetical protein
MLRWLLEQRVALDMPSTAGTTQVGETPLFVAAETGRLDTLRVLADAGANLRHATVSGDTPLRAAARNGHGDCVRFLLRRGVEPRRIDIEECVKLAKDPSALIALLAHGCAVDAALFALTEQSTTFMLLWHAGISRDDMSRMPHITALMRICGAMPPIECSLGEHCRDESELHKQLFFHERQRDEEEIVTTTMIQFIDSLPQKGLALVNDRAVQVLFGLQPLHLPALGKHHHHRLRMSARDAVADAFEMAPGHFDQTFRKVNCTNDVTLWRLKLNVKS